MRGTAVMGCISQGPGETDRAPTVGPLTAQRGRRVRGLGLLPPQVDGSREGAVVGAQGGRRMQTAGGGGLQGGAGHEHPPSSSVSYLQTLAPVTSHGQLWKPGREVDSRCGPPAPSSGAGSGRTCDCHLVRSPRPGHMEPGSQLIVPLFSYAGRQRTHVCEGLNLCSQPSPSTQESGVTYCPEWDTFEGGCTVDPYTRTTGISSTVMSQVGTLGHPDLCLPPPPTLTTPLPCVPAEAGGGLGRRGSDKLAREPSRKGALWRHAWSDLVRQG